MAPHVLESRAHQGRKLRAMYRSLGWSRADCAKFLHVTERCLRNWEMGRHAVPFAAFKLMRLHLRYDLPGKDWEGWHIAAGKLWTPEGHGLNPHDAKWWSMLHRRVETGWNAFRARGMFLAVHLVEDVLPITQGISRPGASLPFRIAFGSHPG